MNERVVHGKHFADRLDRGDLDEAAWLRDLQGWYGTDRTRLRVETDGEQALGRSGERARLDAQWSRLVTPYWGLQLGVGYRGAGAPTGAIAGAWWAASRAGPPTGSRWTPNCTWTRARACVSTWRPSTTCA